MTYPTISKVFLLGKETTWGTAVTADKDCGLIVTDIGDNFTREVNSSRGINSRDAQFVDGGIVDIKSNVTGEFQHGRLLEYLFGTVAHVETTSDWKHTFTLSDTPPSFTMQSSENMTTDTVLTHAGMLTESCTVRTALNEKLTMAYDFAGKTTLSSDSASAAVISSLPVFPHALCGVEVNGVAATEVQEATITATVEVVRSGGISSNLYQQGHAVTIDFEYTAKLGFTDKTFQELWLGGTSPSATSNPTVFNFEINADNGVALGSGRREFKLTLTKTIGSKFTKVATVPGLIFIDIAGTGTLSECYSVDDISSASW